uniref:ImpL2 protein n=1 Tax=Drosophila melanogaster TaxID=7227 RepID=Q24364_DROME|nr:ORF1 [Drosophila melanogaster]
MSMNRAYSNECRANQTTIKKYQTKSTSTSKEH